MFFQVLNRDSLLNIFQFTSAHELARFHLHIVNGSKNEEMISIFSSVLYGNIFPFLANFLNFSPYIQWLSRTGIKIQFFAMHDRYHYCRHNFKDYWLHPMRKKYDYIDDADIKRLTESTGNDLRMLRLKTNTNSFSISSIINIASHCHSVEEFELDISEQLCVIPFPVWKDDDDDDDDDDQQHVVVEEKWQLQDCEIKLLSFHLPNLRKVQICGEGIKWLTGESAGAFLKHCPLLEDLRFLQGEDFVRDIFFSHLHPNENLQILYITSSYGYITNDGLHSFNKFPKLNNLFLSYEDQDDSIDRIDNDGIANLLECCCPNLTLQKLFIGCSQMRTNLRYDNSYMDNFVAFDNDCFEYGCCAP